MLIAALAITGLVVTSATPALSAVSPLTLAKKALKLAKKADKKATQALTRTLTPGPAGLAGAKGDAGHAGLAGPTGIQGLPGGNGLTGDTGAPGAPGAAGQPGAPGDAGAPGQPGAPGAAGSGFVFRGEWANSDKYYNAGDVVTYEGSAWIFSGPTTYTAEPPAAPWSLLAAAGAPGATGQPGQPGPPGEPGAEGPAAVAQTYVADAVLVAAGAAVTQDSIVCPVSMPKVLGGGFSFAEQAQPYLTILESRPIIGGNGWVVGVRNGGNGSLNVGMYAVCTA
jgi:hypothetical protein